MTDSLDARLRCLHCDRETDHSITYVGPYLNRIRCKECGTEIALDRTRAVEFYASDALERILTKPHRMTEEMRNDLTTFLASLPIRVITKPYRMAREILDVAKDPDSGECEE